MRRSEFSVGRSEDPGKINKDNELSIYELSNSPVSAMHLVPENKLPPWSFQLGSAAVKKLLEMAFNIPKQGLTFEHLRSFLSEDLELILPRGIVSSSDNDDHGWDAVYVPRPRLVPLETTDNLEGKCRCTLQGQGNRDLLEIS